MAEDLNTPSSTLVKVRWQEPHVSEGLNKKLNGLVPHGVIRGGRLGTSALNSTVVVEVDADSGDAVYSAIDANGHQLTFRQTSNVNLDLDTGTLPGTTAYIGLDVSYSTGSATTVKWRGYSSAEIDADPTIVCLGAVDVPAVAAVIPASDIYGDRRTDGGLAVSGGMRPWKQIIKNPSFEGHEVICNAAAGIVEFPHWQFNCQFSAGQIHTLTPDSTPAANPRSGVGTLGIEGGGAGSHNFNIYPDIKPRVFAGQMVRFSVWVRGTSVTFGSGASGYARVGITGYEYDGGGPPLFTNEQLDGTVLTGTFDYTELSGTFVIPADVAYVQLQLSVVDSTSLSGTLEFDDFRFWIEPGPIENPLYQDMAVVGSEQNTEALVVSPNTAQTVLNPATVRERSIRLGCESSSAGSLEYAWKPAKDAVTSFLMNLPKGRLSLGDDLVSAIAEAVIPRLTTEFLAVGDSRYTLLWEIPRSGAASETMRLYATSQPTGIGSHNQVSLVVTINAEWTTSSNWQYDNSGVDATRMDFARDGVFYFTKNSGGTTPWVDGDWDDNVEAYRAFQFIEVGSLATQLTINDGHFRFDNSTTGTGNQATNPDHDAPLIVNGIYAKSVCKAWIDFSMSSGTPTINDGFNLSVGTAGNDLPMTFSRNLVVTSSGYSVVVTVDGFGHSTTTFRFGLPLNRLTTGFDISFAQMTTTPNITSLAASSFTGRVNVVVLGRQDS